MNDCLTSSLRFDTLPAWVVCVNALWMPLVAAVTAPLATWCAIKVARRLAGEPPLGGWVERARVLYPVRIAAGQAGAISSVILVSTALAAQGPLAVLPLGVAPWLTGIAALLGVAAIAHRELRILAIPAAAGGSWAGDLLIGFVLTSPHGVLVPLVVSAALLASPAIALGALAASIVAVVWAAHGAALPVLVRLGLAAPASERLAAAVDEAARKVGSRPRAAYELHVGVANALAFPPGGRLVVTSPALRSLDDEELAAICLHELAHLGESRWTSRLRIAPHVLVVMVAASPLIARLHVPVAAVVVPVALAALVVLAMLARRKQRREEIKADGLGHAHEASDGIYARALERLYELNAIPAVLSTKRATHPQLYDRLLAAGVTPTYERPAPPPKWPARAGVTIALLVTAITLGAILVPIRLGVAAHVDPSETTLLAHLAIFGDGTREVTALAHHRERGGDADGAESLYRIALALDPRLVEPATDLATLLGTRGRCEEAREALLDAKWTVKWSTTRIRRRNAHLLAKATRAVTSCMAAGTADAA